MKGSGDIAPAAAAPVVGKPDGAGRTVFLHGVSLAARANVDAGLILQEVSSAVTGSAEQFLMLSHLDYYLGQPLAVGNFTLLILDVSKVCLEKRN